MISGFINLNKPSKITSNKALGILKAVLKSKGFTDKIGHMGTLDPLACGVLPIALGRATRLFDYTLDKVKKYEAEFIFGAQSPSLDTDTEVVYDDTIDVEEDAVVRAMSTLIGEIDQIPPIYSAKSVGGVRAYELARKGKEVELKPKRIKIFSLELIEKVRKNTYRIRIKCSGGTYVRAIGRDIASLLNTTAVMSALTRTQSGIFTLDNAITLEEVRDESFDFVSKVIPCEELLVYYQKIILDERQQRLLLNGIKIDVDNVDGFYSVYGVDDNLLGVGQVVESRLALKTWLI